MATTLSPTSHALQRDLRLTTLAQFELFKNRLNEQCDNQTARLLAQLTSFANAEKVDPAKLARDLQQWSQKTEYDTQARQHAAMMAAALDAQQNTEQNWLTQQILWQQGNKSIGLDEEGMPHFPDAQTRQQLLQIYTQENTPRAREGDGDWLPAKGLATKDIEALLELLVIAKKQKRIELDRGTPAQQVAAYQYCLSHGAILNCRGIASKLFKLKPALTHYQQLMERCEQLDQEGIALNNPEQVLTELLKTPAESNEKQRVQQLNHIKYYLLAFADGERLDLCRSQSPSFIEQLIKALQSEDAAVAKQAQAKLSTMLGCFNAKERREFASAFQPKLSAMIEEAQEPQNQRALPVLFNMLTKGKHALDSQTQQQLFMQPAANGNQEEGENANNSLCDQLLTKLFSCLTLITNDNTNEAGRAQAQQQSEILLQCLNSNATMRAVASEKIHTRIDELSEDNEEKRQQLAFLVPLLAPRKRRRAQPDEVDLLEMKRIG